MTQNSNSKKNWSAGMALRDVIEMGIDLSIKCRQKNSLANSPAQLYHCFVAAEQSALDYFEPVGSLFKFSQKDTPYTDSARDQVLRMLSVASKCHFFLFHDDKLAHEPYFFTLPDPSNISQSVFGLYYRVSSSKVIIVCPRDLAAILKPSVEKEIYENKDKEKKSRLKVSTKSSFIYDFPTVVGSDSFKWFHYKKWYRLKEESEKTFGKEKEFNIDAKKHAFSQLKTINNYKELEQKAHILQIPYDLKDLMAECGCQWNPNLKVWFLPKGYDLDCVSQYLNYLKSFSS